MVTSKFVQAGIRVETSRLQHEIIKLSDELETIRNFCTHPDATKINNGSSGSWDNPEGSYWRECECPDCGKKWTESQ